MEPALDRPDVKIKAIAQGPNAELLPKLVEVLYEQAERREEFDEEPFSPEDLAAIKKAKRPSNEANLSAWRIMKRNVACELRVQLSCRRKSNWTDWTR